MSLGLGPVLPTVLGRLDPKLSAKGHKTAGNWGFRYGSDQIGLALPASKANENFRRGVETTKG